MADTDKNKLDQAVYGDEDTDKADPKKYDGTTNLINNMRGLAELSQKSKPVVKKGNDTLADALYAIQSNDPTKLPGQVLDGTYETGSKYKKIKESKKYKDFKESIETNIDGADPTEAERPRISLYDDYEVLDSKIPQLSAALDTYADSIISPDDLTQNMFLSRYDDESSQTQDYANERLNQLMEDYPVVSNIRPLVRNGLKLGDQFMLVIDMNKLSNQMINEDVDDPVSDGNGEILDESVELTESAFNDSSYDSELHALYENVYIGDKNTYEAKSLLDEAHFVKEIKREVSGILNENVSYSTNYADLMKQIYNNDSPEVQQAKDKDLGFTGAYTKVLDPRDVVKLEVDDAVLGYLLVDRTVGASAGGQGSKAMSGGGSSSREQPTSFDYSSGSQQTDSAGQFAGGFPSGSMLNQIGQQAAALGSDSTVKGQDYNHMDGSLTGPRYHDTALRYDVIKQMFIDGLADKLDKKFIKNNEKFKSEIFALLRKGYIFEKGVRISYLAPNEVFHLKIDSTSTYGISRLANSLFSGKLYLAQLVSDQLMAIARGKERRIFYVNIGDDLDAEGTVQEMVRDLRSNEFPVNTFNDDKSITSMFKQLGAGNDAVVPVNDGDPAFTIDTMDALESNVDDDKLDNLLKQAVAGTGVPESFIDAERDTDYARSLVMQNNIFVRKVINYQTTVSNWLTEIIQELYKIEFKNEINSYEKGSGNKKDDDDSNQELVKFIDPDKIKIYFPAPKFLQLQNDSDQFQSVQTRTEFIVNTYFDENDSSDDPKNAAIKAEFKRTVIKDELPNMDWEKYDKFLEDAKVNINENKLEDDTAKDEGSSDEEKSDDGSFM